MHVLPQDKYLKMIKEPDSVLICMPGGECKEFSDSVVGKCDDCGCVIHYRPYNRDATKKICIACATKKTRGKNILDEINVSEKCQEELSKFDDAIAS